MVDMTILHIASPFAVSAPVSESAAPQNDQRDRRRAPGQASAMAEGHSNTSPRDGAGIDPRDARLAARTVDLATPAAGHGVAAESVDAVLAAYGEQAHRRVGGDPIDDGEASPPASLSL